MNAERFDQITRAISTKLSTNALRSPMSMLNNLTRLVGTGLWRHRSLHDDGFPSSAGKPDDLIAQERMRYVRTRRASDVEKVSISPRSFLAKLTLDSRSEFLSILT